MTELLFGATVLIVDKDFGFAFWLAEIFNEAGCQVVPALDCAQAVSAPRELSVKIDVVVVNPETSGVADMIRTLKGLNRSLKVIAIHDWRAQYIRTIYSDAILEKPSGRETISRQAWLERIRDILLDLDRTGAE